MRNKHERGFIGLMALLISFIVLVMLYAWFYTSQDAVQNTPPPDLQPAKADGTIPENRYEQYQADLDAARSTQGLMNTTGRQLDDAMSSGASE